MSDDALVNVHMDALRHPDPCGCALEQLLNAVQTHVRDEAESIATYQRIRETSSDPVLTAVMELILEDEQRHHMTLQRIVARLQAAFDWSPAPETAVPSERQRMAAEVFHKLAADERRGARALRDLARQCRHGDDELARVLLESMAMDSDKHAHLLDFATRRLAR